MSITIFIPFVVSFLFRFGGREQVQWLKPINQKLWRWIGIGLFIGITFALLHRSWKPLLVIPAYALSIQALPYGEKSWLNFMGRDLKWITYGFAFGACSFFCLPFGYGVTASLLGGLSFWVLMSLSNKGLSMDWYGQLIKNDYFKKRICYLDQSIVEASFGFIATVMYIGGR